MNLRAILHLSTDWRDGETGLFSPVFEDPQGKWPGLEPRMLVGMDSDGWFAGTLGLQLHKFIWDPATKGSEPGREKTN